HAGRVAALHGALRRATSRVPRRSVTAVDHRASVRRGRSTGQLGSLRRIQGRRRLPRPVWRLRAGWGGAEEPVIYCRECGDARPGFDIDFFTMATEFEQLKNDLLMLPIESRASLA